MAAGLGDGDGGDGRAVAPGADGPGVGVDPQAAGLDLGLEHAAEGGQAGARLEAEAAHPAVAGIEEGGGLRLSGERVAVPVVVADPLAELVVEGGGPAALDVLMLVEGRDALRGALAAEPGGLLGEADPVPEAGGAEGGRAAAETAADDEDVTFDFLRWQVHRQLVCSRTEYRRRRRRCP